MKRYYYTLVLLTGCLINGNSQTPDTLQLTKKEAEYYFLENNLELIARHLEISQADAQLIQARVWPNPTFEISEVNLWSSKSAEELSPIYKDWGKHSQIALSIGQLIQTGGKRKKNIDLHLLSIEEKRLDFESVLKELKLEFRNTYTEIQVYQAQRKIYQKQLQATEQLLSSYKKQLQQGNISQAEYIRIKAASLQFRKEVMAANETLENSMKHMKALLNVPHTTVLIPEDDIDTPPSVVEPIHLEQWIDTAQQYRPDIQSMKNKSLQASKKIALEKAERIPDLNFSIDYDRGGNIMQDFFGLGLSFDLPIFDRNKGGIKEAQLEKEISEIELQKKYNEVSLDIIEAFELYQQAFELYHSIESDYETSLDQLLQSYYDNFTKGNVSLIEYFDFVEAYLDNKNILLETKRDLWTHFEKLQFSIGKDLQY